MQRTQRLVAASTASEPSQPPTVTGYGYGLFEEFRPWGRSVYHSGGYPGFGSHMRWHPASGLGVIALANGTYAPMSAASLSALTSMVDQLGVVTTTPMPHVDGLERAIAAVRAWLDAADPDGPEGAALRDMWSDNVERDLPWAERLIALESLRREMGPMMEVPGSERRVEAGTVSWDLTAAKQAEGGSATRRVRVTVMVAPHDSRLIQSLTLRQLPSRPDPVSIDLS
jgi:hypothetical protein